MRRTLELAKLAFVGDRFHAEAMDIAILPEILAYYEAVAGIARSIWYLRNSPSEPVPAILKRLNMQLGSYRPSRSEVPILIESDGISEGLATDAASVIDTAIEAAIRHQRIPSTLPTDALPYMRRLGQTLSREESMLTQSVGSTHPARLDRNAREVISGWVAYDADPLPAGVVREGKPIWEVIRELGETIPEEERARIPVDGSLNIDHYLYGAPRRT